MRARRAARNSRYSMFSQSAGRACHRYWSSMSASDAPEVRNSLSKGPQRVAERHRSRRSPSTPDSKARHHPEPAASPELDGGSSFAQETYCRSNRGGSPGEHSTSKGHQLPTFDRRSRRWRAGEMLLPNGDPNAFDRRGNKCSTDEAHPTTVSDQARFPKVRPAKRHSNIRPPKRQCRRPALGGGRIGVTALHLSAADQSPTGGAESPPPCRAERTASRAGSR